MRNLTKYFTFLTLSLTILALLLMLPIWLTMAGLSFMVFDQGISLMGVIFVLILCLLPVIEVILVIFSLKYYKNNRYFLALLWNLPLVAIIAVILWLTGFASGTIEAIRTCIGA